MNEDLKKHWNVYHLANPNSQINIKIILNFFDKYLPKIKEPVLDLGCGTGQNLYSLYKRGFTEIYGIDFSEEAIASSKRLFENETIITKLFLANMD